MSSLAPIRRSHRSDDLARRYATCHDRRPNVPPERWCDKPEKRCSWIRGSISLSISSSPDMLAIGHLPKLDCICVLIIPALRPSVAALLSCRVTFPRWPFPLHRLIRPAVKVASSSSNLITDQRSLPFFNYSDEHLPGMSPGYAGDISGSRTTALPNTAMSCRARRLKPNRKAACRCLAIASQPESTHPSISNPGLKG